MSKLLEVGAKLYGIYGEAEIVKIDYGSEKYPYKISYKKTTGKEGFQWLTSDLASDLNIANPVMYKLEDCPDIYKPKVRKYKVLFARDNGDVILSGEFYETLEEFNDKYSEHTGIELVKHLYKDEWTLPPGSHEVRGYYETHYPKFFMKRVY